MKKYHAICFEFQNRGSPHVHSFIWNFNARNIQNETAYIEYIEKTINTQLPDHLKDPELLELVKTCQIHAYSGTYLKHNKNERKLLLVWSIFYREDNYCKAT